MLRFVFNAITLLSVLVFILAAAFWVRGQFASACVSCSTAANMWDVGGSRSGVGVFVMFKDVADDASRAAGAMDWSLRHDSPQNYKLWVAYAEVSTNYARPQIDFLHVVLFKHPLTFRTTGTVIVIHIPYWLILLLSAILPATWVIRRRFIPRRRRRLGLCVHCGYDLRSTVAHCPECGLPSGYAVSGVR